MQAGVLIGIALMAGVDEIIFHQVLGWHHFYDRATPAIGLMTDGLLHSAELIALVAGFFLFAELRQRRAFDRARARAAFFIGAGGFQLFDGIVDHKLLRLHQICYVENVFPYDIAWNLSALVLLCVGLLLLAKARRVRP
ncbi:MAG: DUF2243 domain-containing protein [Gammaproteobacteria bacterium]